MGKVDPSINIPTASSEAQDWIQWHKELKAFFNKKEANSIWVYAWSRRGGEDSSANTGRLRDYMSSQGIDIQRTRLDAIQDAASDVFGGIGDVLNAVKWIAIIGGSAIALIYVVKIAQNSGVKVKRPPKPKLKLSK